MNRDLIIAGAGGFGREVQWLIERINQSTQSPEERWNLLGYVDDGIEQGTLVDDLPVLGGMEYLQKRNSLSMWSVPSEMRRSEERLFGNCRKTKTFIFRI